jgi:hypothetical protein
LIHKHKSFVVEQKVHEDSGAGGAGGEGKLEVTEEGK